MRKITILTIFLLTTKLCFAQEKEIKLAFDNLQKYTVQAQTNKNAVKEAEIVKFRAKFNKDGYRRHKIELTKTTWQEALKQLGADGLFADLREKELKLFPKSLAAEKVDASAQGDFLTEAMDRLAKIGIAHSNNKLTYQQSWTDAYQKAILHYGELEISRSNKMHRFHASCFALPTAAMNIYYCFMSTMEQVEAEKIIDQQMVAVSKMLKSVALQAWTQPLRNDFTDDNVVQIERFRNHVWWVGGNGLAYRSLLPIACMIRSVPMIDLLSEVAQRGVSATSQNTNQDSFWTEGFTADGAGWGHGKQCLIFGYPIDGTLAALNLMSAFKNTAWDKKLNQQNKNAIFNYLQGSNWYYYKGFDLPCLSRGSLLYQANPSVIKSNLMIKTIFADWFDSFNKSEQAELTQLNTEMKAMHLSMNAYPQGMYNGTRWFFNNDDLIKKNENYHIIVNMASVRCDGVESAPDMADAYNFTTADGLTLFQRSGREYTDIIGAWDVLVAPGITAREGMDKLKPVTNWKGYCSKFNFAGAATFGGENAVAGYVFDKMNASEKKGTNDTGTSLDQNSVLFGVKAFKSYFILGDYFIALGAGVTNHQSDMEGLIRTGIDQTKHEGQIEIMTATGKKQTIAPGVHSFVRKGKASWLIQKGKFAYTVLPQFTKQAYYSTEIRKADWGKMNFTARKANNNPKEVDVLQMWVNHGQQPKDDTYGYVVYSAQKEPSLKLPFTVLRNDTLVQAIQSKDAKVVEAVFYSAQKELVAKNMVVKVSNPCVLLLENSNNMLRISVNDPTMNKDLNQIEITINTKKLIIDLPQGDLCGKPAVVSLKM